MKTLLSRVGIMDIIQSEYGDDLQDAFDCNEGICFACGEIQGGCEPDARLYECEACGEKQVYGIEETVLTML